jgi:hypothetical protein
MLLVKIQVFVHITPCRLFNGYRRFEEIVVQNGWEAHKPFEIQVIIYKATRCHIQEDLTLDAYL